MFNKGPWIWVAVAFGVLIASWVVLLHLANHHKPQSVPIEISNSGVKR